MIDVYYKMYHFQLYAFQSFYVPFSIYNILLYLNLHLFSLELYFCKEEAENC